MVDLDYLTSLLAILRSSDVIAYKDGTLEMHISPEPGGPLPKSTTVAPARRDIIDELNDPSEAPPILATK